MPPPGVSDPSQVEAMNTEAVEVRAVEPRVQQATAFTDCCVLCEEQVLEALRPTPNGPLPREADNRLPLRRKFCGTVTRYGVNDELADPRDIMLNILPQQAPYTDFVAGFVNTEETPLKGNDLLRFGGILGFTRCDPQECRLRAPQISGKVIHAEVTPDEHFYGQDARFLPIEGSPFACGAVPGAFPSTTGNPKCLDCLSSWDCKSELEPADGLAGKQVCVYGVYAIDHGPHHSASSHREFCCSPDPSHDRPEIHPFDAVWWRHPEGNGLVFGVFQDDSNRYSFPHCGDNNENTWSQAPRDLIFHFPFKFPLRSSPQRACLRHVRTRKLRDNKPNVVAPLNVTTGALSTLEPEVTTLLAGRRVLLQVVKEPGSERETHVHVQGSIVGDNVVGQIILRITVGCDNRSGNRGTRSQGSQPSLFDSLRARNSLVTYDGGDPGAGYFYAELKFECACAF
ncbi:MAG: hypothetical protein AUG51_00145 [Acidobacteria bacterium 13_1_20CM_3_53_8]|nr:MAG: hypothetical protein AUG51_00145 [Acidobacteria bacterium 13_1_20CM_3_53_8]